MPVAVSQNVSLAENYHAATNCTTVPTVPIINMCIKCSIQSQMKLKSASLVCISI